MPWYRLKEGVDGKLLPTLNLEFQPGGEPQEVPEAMNDPDFEEVPAPAPPARKGGKK